jgi:hypothetical protein
MDPDSTTILPIGLQLQGLLVQVDGFFKLMRIAGGLRLVERVEKEGGA